MVNGTSAVVIVISSRAGIPNRLLCFQMLNWKPSISHIGAGISCFPVLSCISPPWSLLESLVPYLKGGAPKPSQVRAHFMNLFWMLFVILTQATKIPNCSSLDIFSHRRLFGEMEGRVIDQVDTLALASPTHAFLYHIIYTMNIQWMCPFILMVRELTHYFVLNPRHCIYF